MIFWTYVADAMCFRSKFELHPDVYLSACKVVWYGVLLVGYICNPVERIDVVDAEEIQAVNAKPYIAEDVFLLAFVVVEHPVAHTNVCPFVCRCSE